KKKKNPPPPRNSYNNKNKERGDKSMKPLVSIIIPMFNVERYIKACLESCINQSLKEIEILVVDDCGNDGSLAIAQDYAKRDNRIRIIRNKQNLKTCKTRISGAMFAMGDYILFVDGDDFIDLKTCEITLNKAKEGFDMVAPDASSYRSDLDIPPFYNFAALQGIKEVRVQKLNIFKPNIFYSNADFVKNYNKTHHLHGIIISSKLILKERFLNAAAYFASAKDISTAEDVALSFVLWRLCDKFCFLENVLYFHVHNPNSMSRSKTISKLPYDISCFENVLDLMHSLQKGAIFPDFKLSFMQNASFINDLKKEMPKVSFSPKHITFSDSKDAIKFEGKFIFFIHSHARYLKVYLDFLKSDKSFFERIKLGIKGRIILRRLNLKNILLWLIGLNRFDKKEFSK
ncbi:MAG: glycosyltransferase family 2 protein, partial [Helicobacter sp.]|nr:glycosyltransferase family 2 protein [Helicobacter sp.]